MDDIHQISHENLLPLLGAFFFEFFFELAVGSGEFFAFLGNIIADLDCSGC